MPKKICFALAALVLTGFCPANHVFLPHIIHGGGYSSTITLSNLMSADTQYVAVHFFKEDGTKWTVPTSNGTSFRINFNLAPFTTAELTVSSTDAAISSGWVRVDTRGALLVSAAYDYLSGGVKRSSAGVLPATSDLLSVLPFFLDPAAGVNTGLAIVNPSTSDAPVTIEAISTQGQTQGLRTITVPAGGKFVAFLTNPSLFPNLNSENGYLKVLSLQPVAAMAMRLEGPVFHSLPAVHELFPWRNSHTVYVSSLTGSDLQNTGELGSPVKTIRRAVALADRGWTIYLLPGLYSAESGETFPVRLSYCTELRGESAESVLIRGGGVIAGKDVNATLQGDDRFFVTDLSISNPDGVGVYITTNMNLDSCRITGCAGTGIEVFTGFPVLANNLVTGNYIGIHITADAAPDMGGGLNSSRGGNTFAGNLTCDLYYEGNTLLGLRFNSWDTADPSTGNVCTGGTDIVAPNSGPQNY